MTKQSTPKTAVVIPNWNGKKDLPVCLDSLLCQTLKPTIIVVENGSVDGSAEFIEENYPDITLIKKSKNYGFSGGVNIGIQYALDHNFTYIGILNNDAEVDQTWLEQLVSTLDQNKQVGIVTSKIVSSDGSYLDSTGEFYTTWGLPFPRGRSEKNTMAYDKDLEVFGASGGATLYRADLFRHIGLFDDKFFAYYEDIDISFRAQLAGWKVYFNPKAITKHQISATGGKVKGFFTYQTMKNLPILFWKNIPLRYTPIMFPRLFFAYWMFVANAFTKGNGLAALKGNVAWLLLIPHTFMERWRIKKLQTVPDTYIWSQLVYDLPPQATRLRTLRAKWWSIRRKK